MKRQQLAQLRRLVWFDTDELLDALRAAQQQQRLERRRLQLQEDRPKLHVPGGDGNRDDQEKGGEGGEGEGEEGEGAAGPGGRRLGPGGEEQQGQGLKPSSAFLVLPLGGSGRGAGHGGGAGNGGEGGDDDGRDAALQLHMCSGTLLDELIAGAKFSRAAYGYVVAAGHLSSLTGALKMIASMPVFDPITGGWGIGIV